MAKCKLTPELQTKICELIREGNYANVAAGAVGITEKTFYDWLKKGEAAPNSKFGKFCKAVAAAKHEAEADRIKLHKTFECNSEKAVEWWLQHARPEHWLWTQTQQAVSISGDGFKISFEIVKNSADSKDESGEEA